MGRVTKSRTAALALASFAALSGACNDDKRARSDPPRELDVETARAAEDEPGEQHPIVELEGSGLRLDGKSLASTSAIARGTAPSKIEELYQALKVRREGWKQAHPGATFPGVVGIRIVGGLSVVVFKSVFQTAAYAGYPYVSVQGLGGRDDIVDLSAQIPGPPRMSDDPEPKPEPMVLHTHLAGETARLVWSRGNVDHVENLVSLGALAATACEGWSARGEHKDPTDPLADKAVLHASNDDPSATLRPLSDALLSCKRRFPDSAEPQPVFALTFAMK
ncbi:MAG: hypothetical protein IPM79_38495 [Polyangiaceae bacterium]|nr:hypothetical protein [Polyangiaceae bacterium]